jgi:dTDP-glucose pyrophosphorylase
MIIKNDNFKKYLFKKKNLIINAIKKINSLDIKFLIILDEKNSVVGTITDGDLRRAIIKKISLTNNISFIMNKKFIFLKKNISNDFGQLILKKKLINVLPILNLKKKLEYLIVPDQKNSLKQIRENVILLIAGGKGKRLMPYTKYVPKPLLKISQNTIIHDLILNSMSQGFYNFIISINYKAEKFKKIFDNGSQLNCNIKYLHERKPLGTAGPIKLLKKKDFKNKPIIIMNADLITNIDLTELLNFHNQNKNDLTVCVKNITLSIPYGEIEFSKKGINKIHEKPNKTYFINIGIYAINQSILKVLKKEKEFFDMNSLINLAIKKDYKVKAFPVYENWQDIGNKLDFNKLRKKN